MWSNVISPTSPPSNEFTNDENNSATATTTTPPPTRYKHASTLHYSPASKSKGGGDEHFIFVYGGRSGTFALKDFWELNLNSGVWREIKQPSNSNNDNCWPPILQEHTLVSANNRLYLFGGECHHNSDVSSHLWVWSRAHEEIGWEKIRFSNSNGNGNGSKGKGLGNGSHGNNAAPVMRRGHSAVVCDVEGVGLSMVIFGGYRDLKGSLGDCWCYGVATNTWHLLSTSSSSSPSSSNSKPSSSSIWSQILSYWTNSTSSSQSLSQQQNQATTSTSYTNLIASNGSYYTPNHHHNNPSIYSEPVVSGAQPQPRHNHSAVAYNNRMYVYGGMCDLIELSDFWVFEFETRRWSQVKCFSSSSPGVLKGHAATVVGSFMYLFGGEGKGGVRVDDVWRFDFVGETFERLQFPGCHPCPRVFATATKLPRRRQSSTTITNRHNNQRQQQQNKLPQQESQQQLPSQQPTRPTTFVQQTGAVKKSTSSVRFSETQHLVTFSSEEPSSSTKTSPTSVGILTTSQSASSNLTPSCSDYSSMETINYVENPNYYHHSNGGGEAFEMKRFDNNSTNKPVAPLPIATNVNRSNSMSYYKQQHAEYVLVIGGLEMHKSHVFSKRDLVVWRLKVDCFCHGNDDEDDGDERGFDDGDGDEADQFGTKPSSVQHPHNNFEVEF